THYVAVFDGSILKLYVNGALYSQTAATAPGDTTGIPVKMGAHYSNPSTYGYINGKLDDARIYSRALSASEVAALFSSAGSGSPAYVTVSTSSSPTGAGATTGGGTVTSGSGVTVTASANAGYTFANWTENGTVVSTSASYTFAANANRNLLANFTVTSRTGTRATRSGPSVTDSRSAGAVDDGG